MEKTTHKFTQIVSYILLITGMIFIGYQTVELIWEVAKGFYNRFQEAGLDFIPEYFKPVAILFFNILLFLEILETVKVFDKEHEIKIRIIIIVCLIAISRKVLVMDTHKSDPLSDLAIAALILAFSISYFLVRKSEKLAERRE